MSLLPSPSDKTGTKEPTPPQPPEQQPADGHQDLWTVTVLGILLILLIPLYFYLTQTHSTDLGLRDITEKGNLLYMVSAIISASGALLIAGVIVLAPLLSLSLHQSYDALFALAEQLLRANRDLNQEQIALVNESIQTLRHHLRWYKILNPIYYGFWIAACVFLLFATGRMIVVPWVHADVFHEAMSFFILSCILCLGFAGVSVAFFNRIKPGVTKLDFFIRYFNTMSPNREKNNIKRTSLIGRMQPWLLITVGLLIAVLVVSAIFWRPYPSEPRVSIAVNSLAVASGPVFVARDPKLRFDQKVGIEIQEVPFTAGRLALDALLGGQVDVATAAETPVLLASVQRPDLRIILTIAESEFRIVARKSSKISSSKGLRGKRLAVFAGTSSEYFLDRMLEKEGIKKSEVKIVNLQPGDMVFAIRNRNVDAISVWEPHAQRAIDILGDDAVIFEDRNLYIERFNLVTTSEVLDNKEKKLAIEKFVRTVTAASDHMRKQPKASISIVASNLGMGSLELGAIWNRFTFPANIDLPKLQSSFDKIENWSASKQKRNPRDPVSLRGLVDPDILRESNKGNKILSP